MRARRTVVLMAALIGAACSSQNGSTAIAEPPANFPALDVSTVADGLDHPWDVVTAPDGTILTGERAGRFVALLPDGRRVEPRADLSDLYVSSETGLMGIALATDFAQSRRFYTCQGSKQGGGGGGSSLPSTGSANSSGADIRIISWTADPQWNTFNREGTVLAGLPTVSGRHAGCRILPRPDGTLFIGTGDSAQPTVPQDPRSLGGKTLHITANGRPAPGNPDPASPIYTLGHRNVQGLAVRPGSDQIYGIEQGTDRDDEVNLLQSGSNYGYRPDRTPGIYDESVPMTDPVRVPGAVGAVWSSGDPTIATASGSFTTGGAWGAWNNTLAIGALKGKQVRFIALSQDGRSVTGEATPPELSNTYGRIRTVSAQADGSLLVTTDNGGSDKILRVKPR